MTKKVLGRGLSSLIAEVPDNHPTQIQVQNVLSDENALFVEIPIELIEANPYQPRSEFNPEELTALAESIQRVGIIQPITVRRISSTQYQIISGERRYRAAKIAGEATIPSYIREIDDEGSLEMALEENLKRVDLNAIEIALSFQRFMDECGYTQEKLSERVGMNRSTIANYLRLLKLPAEVQSGIIEKLISMGHARCLIGIDNEDIQIEIAKKIAREQLSVRQVEQLVKKLLEPKPEKPEIEPFDMEKYADLMVEFSEKLEKVFQSKVQIKTNAQGGARISLDINNEDAVRNIIDQLKMITIGA
jgi:ParB family chromosome partitioning protein